VTDLLTRDKRLQEMGWANPGGELNMSLMSQGPPESPTLDAETQVELTLVDRKVITDGVVALEFAGPDASDGLPRWTPGAHIDVTLTPGMTRQYSLCGDPNDRHRWRIAVLRENNGRGGSSYVHDQLRTGDIVSARGPRNHFQLAPAERYIFVAGGIGITPILPMIVAAERAGQSWELHYGGRTRQSMAFVSELSDLGGADRVHLHPQDEVGLLDLATILGAPTDDALVYCCGPGPLLDAVEERCARWPVGALHTERFAPKPQQVAAAEEPFEVELAQSGRVLLVNPNQSLLEVVRAAGVDVLSSCQEGTCGTCETIVLSGKVDHRDSILSPGEQQANDTMFICVSRAACPRLVIDR
jgi:ferredoxin-NADP reductase